MGTKIIKTTWFYNQNENKGKPISKSKSWNKNNKNTTHANNNPTKFYCKEEMKQGYDKKMYLKLVLNNFTFIYTY